MEAKGHVLLKQEFTHTKNWPNPQIRLSNDGITSIDLEKEYKDALRGSLCLVMDIGVDGSYLVLGESKTVGQFLWMIEKEDTVQFLPIIKKNGIVMPAGMTPLEEFAWLAKYHFNN